jgi:hypothetical protein
VRVIYPFATTFPEALASLPSWAEQVDVSQDDEAYFRLLASLWHEAEDFVIVEQDQVLPPGALEGFEACPELKCGHGTWLYGGWGIWHGCVRYRREMMLAHPGLMESIQTRHWSSLDSAVINHLRLLGYPEAHWHWPASKHLVPKIYIGPQTGQFIQCRCGAAFGNEVFERNPLTCQECGTETWTPTPERTATDITL